MQKKQNKSSSPQKVGPHQGRNEFGLLNNVNYVFQEDGFIDWRSMVAREHLYPKRTWFEKREKAVPRNIDGLKDDQLLIKISGIKELAKTRGFTKVTQEVVKCDLEHVAIKCGISWLPNYETDGQEIYFEDVGNATVYNTKSFAKKCLETIAANRAFVRSVRNFLNIHIVGESEIIEESDDLPSNSFESREQNNFSIPSTQDLLKNLSIESGIENFSNFKNFLRDLWTTDQYRNEEAKNWLDYSDIPTDAARQLMGFLNSLSKKSK